MNLKNNFLLSWNYIKKIRKYIYFSIGIFILFLVISLIFPTPIEIKDALTKYLQELLNKTKDLSLFEMIFFIFKNNLFVSFLGTFLGVIFCLIPFSFALSNGYVLGYVIKMVIANLGFSDGVLSLWKILPHGIFELPAIFISLGMGLKLGISAFQSLNRNNSKSFFGNLKNAFRVFVLVVLPLLILAAIIEGCLLIFFG